ncbi:hypothetical protein BS639_17590 [Rouxiella silvae]|uniref:Probable 2-phosphosulfolactate phosphatase n=1 Tax=Rouxiella silvae TaxID=1646373 RepID=A0ABX3TXC1_9GAMM|nr:2-phosphosulfolactate phosphatase [Rouxiella silvae]ORJ19899.1 hypothetical protein BS639_17590 [Rouxiella silvae]
MRGITIIFFKNVINTLSPQSLLRLTAKNRLVLPSPNGSVITFKAKALLAKSACRKTAIFSASLRNLKVTALACQRFSNILIVPCGEKWADGSLRPSLEDLTAAGGVIAQLKNRKASPEAQAAAAIYHAVTVEQLRQCSSAQELIERGFADDVSLCLTPNVSGVACQLVDDAFIAVPTAFSPCAAGSTRLISGP